MKGFVYRNEDLAGSLEKSKNGQYIFTYDKIYFADNTKPPISLTLPKTKLKYKSRYLFPFFFNMLSEGENKKIQSRHLKIDENDFFGLLLAIANNDTIGAVKVVLNEDQ